MSGTATVSMNVDATKFDSFQFNGFDGVEAIEFIDVPILEGDVVDFHPSATKGIRTDFRGQEKNLSVKRFMIRKRMPIWGRSERQGYSYCRD